MSKEEATTISLQLVTKHGLRWTKRVPKEAWDQLAEVNEALSEADSRAALGRNL